MDARAVKFVQLMGLESIYRDALSRAIDRQKKKFPGMFAKTRPELQSQFVAEGASLMANKFAELMDEKFQKKHLDDVLAYLDTEVGRNVIFNLQFVQVGVAEAAGDYVERALARLLESGKK